MDVSVSNPIACTPAFNTYSRGTAWQSGIDSMRCQATTDDHFLSASSVFPWRKDLAGHGTSVRKEELGNYIAAPAYLKERLLRGRNDVMESSKFSGLHPPSPEGCHLCKAL